MKITKKIVSVILSYHFFLTVYFYSFTKQSKITATYLSKIYLVSISQKQCRCMSSCLAVQKAVFHVICSLAVKFFLGQSASLEEIKL